MNRRLISKIVILGDSAVGKTSLLESFLDGKFSQSYKVTIGADFSEKEVIVDGKPVVLEIWDTAGQERFRSMGAAFYRGCDACVLVYDITQSSSFVNVEDWMAQFIEKGCPAVPQKFPFVLIGNKSDLEEQRQVDSTDIRKFMETHPKIQHFQVSAKNCQGVTEAFQKIAEASLLNRQQEPYIPIDVRSRPVGISLNKNQKRSKSICC